MFKKKYGFGENEYEHLPDELKLPKMPLPSVLKKAMENREKAESENADETTDHRDESAKK